MNRSYHSGHAVAIVVHHDLAGKGVENVNGKDGGGSCLGFDTEEAVTVWMVFTTLNVR